MTINVIYENIKNIIMMIEIFPSIKGLTPSILIQKKNVLRTLNCPDDASPRISFYFYIIYIMEIIKIINLIIKNKLMKTRIRL